MVSPGETKRDCWAFEGPYYIENRGEHTVPEQFLKNVVWWVTEGGYCIPDPFNANHYIKVELSNDSLCWAEVCLLDRTGDWDLEGPQFFVQHLQTWAVTFISANLQQKNSATLLKSLKLKHLTPALQHHQKQAKIQWQVNPNKFKSYLQNRQVQENKDLRL